MNRNGNGRLNCHLSRVKLKDYENDDTWDALDEEKFKFYLGGVFEAVVNEKLFNNNNS
jgi:hypothetical protein